ncbi:MAG: biotin--[acetyl-CoA-carboxylase] ligase [Alphaproteobacteria bacterium]|nr:biotin--[acetyl-CoA-carboxylase] ligase [Alphaproteobacteria bacterium]
MNLDWVIETHDEVQSTQDIVMDMARSGQVEGYVVQAHVQSGGRGRHGRKWDSLPGNLFLSVLLRPPCQARDIGQLALIAGLALVEAIKNLSCGDLDEVLSLKWPNDVLINGDKCAGLLLETELAQDGSMHWAVVGVGVNVSAAPEGLGVALNDYTKEGIKADILRDRFLEIMDAHYVFWIENGFDELRQSWLKHAHEQGQNMQVKIGTHLENGFFHDIDAFGNLRLYDDQHRLKTVSSGEVYLY